MPEIYHVWLFNLILVQILLFNSDTILYSWCIDFSSSMKEKCILPMMKRTSVKEGILLWSKNVKGWPTANISQCQRSLIKSQELLIQKLDRFLFRTTENDIIVMAVFLSNCAENNMACGLQWCIWTRKDEGVFLFWFGQRPFPWQNLHVFDTWHDSRVCENPIKTLRETFLVQIEMNCTITAC